jgi:CDP-glucose 4,6-dehydratase
VVFECGSLEKVVNSFQTIFKDLRVLVTGDTGFKGSWLCEWLLLEGANVFGLGLKPVSNPSLFNLLSLDERIDHAEIDIRDLNHLESRVSQIKPQIIFHLAAQPLVRYSYSNPVETYETNVMGTINLLDILRRLENQCVGVFITTDKCYENQEWTHSYRETDPMGGYDPYSSSKGCCELAINSFRNSFFNDSHDVAYKAIASARAGNVIGGGDWAKDRIIPDCIKHIESREPILVRNRHATRPWQHVLEPLSGYLLLAAELWTNLINFDPSNNRNAEIVGAYNFGPDLYSNRSVEDLVKELLKHYEGSWEDQTDPDAPHEASLLNLSIDKAFHKLGWKPKWNFEKTIFETTDWYKINSSDTALIREFTKKQILKYINE